MFKTSQWAVVAAVILAGATGAFAAVGISLSPAGGAAWPPQNGEHVFFNLDLAITGDEEVAGYTYFLATNLSGALRISGHVSNSDVLKRDDGGIIIPPPPSHYLLDPISHYDMGATAPVTGIPELDAVYAPGEPATQTIRLTAQWDLPPEARVFIVNASWNNRDGSMFPFNWTPEPTGGLLLAAGLALMIGRRTVRTGGPPRRGASE
jgi:hypothetical protein